MADQDNFYLTGKELFDEIIKCRIKGRISNDLGMMFQLLSTKYSNHRNFVRYYHLKSDLIAAGCEACCKAFIKFRPYKDKEIEWDEATPIDFDHNIHNNSFADFTTAIHNNFLTIIKAEYRQSNILNEMRLDNGLEASLGFLEMSAEKEAQDKLDAEADNVENVIESVDFMRQSVWENFGGDDSLVVHDETDDDTLIDWNEVAQ